MIELEYHYFAIPNDSLMDRSFVLGPQVSGLLLTSFPFLSSSGWMNSADLFCSLPALSSIISNLLLCTVFLFWILYFLALEFLFDYAVQFFFFITADISFFSCKVSIFFHVLPEHTLNGSLKVRDCCLHHLGHLGHWGCRSVQMISHSFPSLCMSSEFRLHPAHLGQCVVEILPPTMSVWIFV